MQYLKELYYNTTSAIRNLAFAKGKKHDVRREAVGLEGELQYCEDNGFFHFLTSW